MNIYFVGAPLIQKGIEDFDYIASKFNNKFYWFSFKLDPDLIKRYGNINFITGLNENELKSNIKEKMDLLMCCSHFEGFCLPIAEALLLEKPVISYRLEEIFATYQEYIKYIDPFNTDQFAKYIKEIQLIKYGIDKKEAKNYILQNYSPQIVANKLLKIIQ